MKLKMAFSCLGWTPIRQMRGLGWGFCKSSCLKRLLLEIRITLWALKWLPSSRTRVTSAKSESSHNFRKASGQWLSKLLQVWVKKPTIVHSNFTFGLFFLLKSYKTTWRCSTPSGKTTFVLAKWKISKLMAKWWSDRNIWALKFEVPKLATLHLLNGVNFTFWCELHLHHHSHHPPPTPSVWSFATGYYAKNGRMDPILVSGRDTRAKVNTGCILSDQSGQSVPLINLNNSIWKDCINLEENINKTK